VKAVNKAILQALREWGGPALSRQLAPRVSELVGKPVSAKSVGRRLSTLKPLVDCRPAGGRGSTRVWIHTRWLRE